MTDSDDKVYGAIQYASTPNITVVFIVVFITLAIIDRIYNVLSYLSTEYDIQEIYEQLTYKIFVLGLISLLVFFIQTLVGFSEGQPYNIVMLLILFMAFCFLVDAVILINLCRSRVNQLMKSLRAPPDEFFNLYKENFDHVVNDTKVLKYQNAINLVTELNKVETKEMLNKEFFWNRIEVKIIEELFKTVHGLPKEFEFGFYMTNLYIKFLANIGGLTTMSWVILMLLAIVNYIKTKVDNSSESDVCSGGGGDDFVNKANSDVHCYQFFFTYVITCGILLNFGMLITYLMAVRYTRTLLKKGMKTIFKVDDQTDTVRDSMVVLHNDMVRPCCNVFGSSYTTYKSEKFLQQPPEMQVSQKMTFSEKLFETLGWGYSVYTQQQYIFCFNQLHLLRENKVNKSKKEDNNDDHAHQHPAYRLENMRKNSMTGASATSRFSFSGGSAPFSKVSHQTGKLSRLENRKTELQLLLSQLEKNKSMRLNANNNNNDETPSLGNLCCKALGQCFCCCCTKKNSHDDDDANQDEESGRGQQKKTTYIDDRGRTVPAPVGGGINNKRADGGLNNESVGNAKKINLNDIYWFWSPQLFFSIVDVNVLLNTFYAAFYFTQVLPICVAKNAIWWGIVLFVPMILNFNIMRFTLLRSVFLQAATVFDDDMAGQVIDDAIETLTVATMVREKIIRTFTQANEIDDNSQEMTSKRKLKVLKLCFRDIDKDNNGILDKPEFKSFLGVLEVYLTKSKFNLLWRYLDIDCRNTLSFEEIILFIFPELKNDIKEEIRLIKRIRKKVLQNGWNDSDLHGIFSSYQDESGFLKKENLKTLLHSKPFNFNAFQLTDQELKVLFSTVDVDKNGNIDWDEFLSLCYSSATHKSKNSATNDYESTKLPSYPLPTVYDEVEEKDSYEDPTVLGYHNQEEDNNNNNDIDKFIEDDNENDEYTSSDEYAMKTALNTLAETSSKKELQNEDGDLRSSPLNTDLEYINNMNNNGDDEHGNEEYADEEEEGIYIPPIDTSMHYNTDSDAAFTFDQNDAFNNRNGIYEVDDDQHYSNNANMYPSHGNEEYDDNVIDINDEVDEDEHTKTTVSYVNNDANVYNSSNSPMHMHNGDNDSNFMSQENTVTDDYPPDGSNDALYGNKYKRPPLSGQTSSFNARDSPAANQSYLGMENEYAPKKRPPPPLVTNHRGDNSSSYGTNRKGTMTDAINIRFPWTQTGANRKPPPPGYNGR